MQETMFFSDIKSRFWKHSAGCGPRVQLMVSTVPLTVDGGVEGERKCLSKLFRGPNERANISKLRRERAAKADYACSLYILAKLRRPSASSRLGVPANYIFSLAKP